MKSDEKLDLIRRKEVKIRELQTRLDELKTATSNSKTSQMCVKILMNSLFGALG